MPCLLLFGATGMGKTSLVQKFLRDYRSSFDAGVGRTRLPVVSIQMPPAPNERDFYEEQETKIYVRLYIRLGVAAGVQTTSNLIEIG